MKKPNNWFIKMFDDYDYVNGLKMFGDYKEEKTITNLAINEEKMTEILINYQWNEVYISNSKIIRLKNSDYGDISLTIRVKKEDKYDYISLKDLPNNTETDFIYDDDKIRIRFAHNWDIQEFIKENDYFLNDFKISEYMTEPLFKKESK